MPQRSDGRKLNELRPISFETGIQKYADGSVLVSFGNTKVVCAATVETTVPSFAKEQGTGWVTAEYSMLPGSTHTRAQRETKGPKGRTQEIQRLVGRSLRAVVDIKKMWQVSVTVDCDVLQADGGTRTASITGGYVALVQAIEKAQKDGRISSQERLVTGQVAAVSCGIIGSDVFVDLDYGEDFQADVDSNLVMTEKGKLVEVQATAEGEPFSYEQWSKMYDLGRNAIEQLIQKQKEVLGWR